MIEVPAWRYHATQGAKLFVTEDEIAEAEAQGWRDSPAAALPAVDIDNVRDTTPVVDSETPIGEPQSQAQGPGLLGAPRMQPDDGVLAALAAAEDLIEQGDAGEIEEALEAAEEAIEKVQAVVSKKHRRKTS